ncbi:hypothetical protein KKC60_05695 [Patescibacteria group bacterium]|nr:hypothetical protein [Patescibacteria group bacterium]
MKFKKLIKIISSKTGLLIIAFVVAILMWFYVANEGYRVGVLDQKIPIEAFNLSEEVVVANNLGETSLKVRAPLSTWGKIDAQNINAYVDVKDLGVGDYTLEVKISVEDPNVQIIDKDPATVAVVLDEVSNIEREVSVKLDGQPSTGFKTGEPEVLVDNVSLGGAESILEKVSQIVAPVILDGTETEEVKKTVELEALDQEGRKISNLVIFPKTAEVKIPIVKEDGIKTVGIKAKLTGSAASGYYVSEVLLNPSSVTIEGQVETLDKIEYLDSKAININNLNSEQKKTIDLDIPEGVNIIDAKPITVTITVGGEERNREIKISPEFKGLKEGLRVGGYQPGSIRILVSGSADKIDKASPGDFKLSLDLKNMDKGSHPIGILKESIGAPGGVTVKEVLDREVVVEVE